MTFKWRLKKPARVQSDDFVKVSSPGVIVEFETGSFKEAHGLFQDAESSIRDIFGDSVLSHVDFESPATPETPAEPATTRKPRGPNKTKVEAIAPPPLPVPAPVAPTVTLPPNTLAPAPDDGIPAFLDRTGAPPLAPLPPTAPPVGALGPKVVKALDIRKAGSPDDGKALADWLAQHGLTIPGATYDEACRAVLMMSDEKLATAAAQLGV